VNSTSYEAVQQVIFLAFLILLPSSVRQTMLKTTSKYPRTLVHTISCFYIYCSQLGLYDKNTKAPAFKPYVIIKSTDSSRLWEALTPPLVQHLPRPSPHWFVICLCLTHFNLLNAELNPICHLLILLEDLTFMGKFIISISNKMQRYTRHPQHTQTGSNSSTIAADSSTV
jgi:hypothetical protein